jgi:hypothetical protein
LLVPLEYGVGSDIILTKTFYGSMFVFEFNVVLLCVVGNIELFMLFL